MGRCAVLTCLGGVAELARRRRHKGARQQSFIVSVAKHRILLLLEPRRNNLCARSKRRSDRVGVEKSSEAKRLVRASTKLACPLSWLRNPSAPLLLSFLQFRRNAAA